MKRQRQIFRIILYLFILSRLYIWIARPIAFSEIIYSYMPYAQLWASGTKPYLQQWYEYPPATIPLFYIPQMIDMATRFKLFHFDYLNAYRGELLLWDVGQFTLIWLTLKKLKVKNGVFWLSLLYYILVTTKAHDFIYDTMDLTFATATTLALTAPILLNSFAGSVTSWFGFFLATCLKYVNAPLAPIYAFIEGLERRKLKQTLVAALIGFLLVWSIPLAIFRSSILVSLVYQNLRGIQIDSAPAIILRTMNVFTKSEHVIEVYKNYEIAGPLTDRAKIIVKYFFPASLGAFLVLSCYYIWKHPEQNPHWSRIHFTLGYILIFFLTGKVLSTPFLLWQIPLFALYPYKHVKQQLIFVLPSLLIIFTSMSKIPNSFIFNFPIPLIIGWIRTVSFIFLFVMWVKFTKDRSTEPDK